MYCPKCKEEREGSGRFCGECGSPLKNKCKKCGTEASLHVLFCTECGEPFGQSGIEIREQRKGNPDIKFCEECGTRLTEDGRCPNCKFAVKKEEDSEFCTERKEPVLHTRERSDASFEHRSVGERKATGSKSDTIEVSKKQLAVAGVFILALVLFAGSLFIKNRAKEKEVANVPVPVVEKVEESSPESTEDHQTDEREGVAPWDRRFPEPNHSGCPYYIIFTDGYRSGQIEMIAFDLDLDNEVERPYFVWDQASGEVTLKSTYSVNSDCPLYYFYKNQWEEVFVDDKFHIDSASAILSSSFDVQNRQGKVIVPHITERGIDEPIDAYLPESTDDFLIVESDCRFINEADLLGFTAEDCRLARNELYARHGRIFDDASLREYFSQFDWYQPSIAPNDFTEDMLNEYEIYNRDFIVDYEKKQGYR